MFAIGATMILVPVVSNKRSTLRNCKPDTVLEAVKPEPSVLAIVQVTVTL